MFIQGGTLSYIPQEPPQQDECQGLAGPWYARRERGAVKARVQ